MVQKMRVAHRILVAHGLCAHFHLQHLEVLVGVAQSVEHSTTNRAQVLTASRGKDVEL